MQHITDYRYLQSREATFVFANRKRIKQRLRRMFVRAVASIHNRSAAGAGQMLGRTGG